MPQHRAAQLEGKCPTFSRLSRFSWPLSARSSVLFPAPGGPSSSVRRPGRSTEDTPCRMGIFRRRLPGLARCRQGDEQIKGGWFLGKQQQCKPQAKQRGVLTHSLHALPATRMPPGQPMNSHLPAPLSSLAPCGWWPAAAPRAAAAADPPPAPSRSGFCTSGGGEGRAVSHWWALQLGGSRLRAGSAAASSSVHLSNTATLLPQRSQRPMHRLYHSHAPTVPLHAAMSPQTQLT